MFLLKCAVAAICPLIASYELALAENTKLLFPTTMRPVMPQLIQQFEQSTGHKVTSDSFNIGVLTKRIQGGEVADVVIVSQQQIEQLIDQKKVVSGTQVQIAKTSIIMIVKKGAQKPDIRSVDSFKSTLLQARSIAFNNPTTGGPTGIFATGLIQRLGLSDELKAKLRLAPNGIAAVNELIATEAAEIAFTQTSEVLGMPDVEVVGTLPPPFDHATVFLAAIVANGSAPVAGKALIAFLVTADAQSGFRTIGLQ